MLDARFCALGLLPTATGDTVRRGAASKLYAGRLTRVLPQCRTRLGLTPYDSSSRNIAHDIRGGMPISDCSIEVYQSEDVFEHVPRFDIPGIVDEIFGTLKPGGLFRLSMPDYRCDILLNRTLVDERGAFTFEPGGGGRLIVGRVAEGGHVWFPTFENVQELFENSCFASDGNVGYLHCTAADGSFVLRNIGYTLGYVSRAPDSDDRVRSPRRPLSVVVDAVKL